MSEFNNNKMLNEKERRQGKTILESFATNIIVTLSSRCNLNCIMCEVKNTQWDIPKKVIQGIFELFPYIECVSWQGGEPFLLDYFEEIFNESIKFQNLKQTIVTNGLLITESWAEKLANNNVELVFSVDGVTKEIYERIRVGAKFDDVIKGIKLISKAKRNSFSKNMTLRLHVVIMKSNYHQLEAFVDFAKEHGFDAISLISIWGNPDSEENIFHRKQKDALDHISAVRNKIEEKARRYNVQLLNSLPLSKNDNDTESDDIKKIDLNCDNLFCQLPWQQLNIDPGGGVRPGCLCLRSIGNILENNLRDIWNNEEMELYRKKIINRDYESWCNPACLSGQISQELKGS